MAASTCPSACSRRERFGSRAAGLDLSADRSAGFDRHGDVLRDPGELLRHPVPPREHRVFSDFEYASHGREWCTKQRWGAKAGRGEPAGACRSAWWGRSLPTQPGGCCVGRPESAFLRQLSADQSQPPALQSAGGARSRAAAPGISVCSQCSITARFFSSSHCSFTFAHSATAARKVSYSCAMRWRTARYANGRPLGILASFSCGAVNCMASRAR